MTLLFFIFASIFGLLVGIAFRFWPFMTMFLAMMIFWGLFSRIAVGQFDGASGQLPISSMEFLFFASGFAIGYWLEKLQNLATLDWKSLSPHMVLSVLFNTDAYESLRQKGPNRQERAQNINDAYTEAAVRFGAMIADADDNATDGEFATLCDAFDIPSSERRRARKIFDEQIENPRRLSSVLQTLRVIYPPAGGVMEVFILSASKVALQDGYIHPRELNLIRLAAEFLGFAPFQRIHLLVKAGLIDPSEAEKAYSYGHGTQAAQDMSERARQLSILGLKAGANEEDIRSAWRGLARKHHPDILRSKGLSEGEMKIAEAKMVEINAAYEALTA